MEKLSKNRGVISVFLLIIFVVTYVAMGMLVDAARYRMSRTYAEAALDMATESILASYNNTLFEVYGLFGADIKTDGKTVEEALKEAYTNYLSSVFETLSIEDGSYTTELANLLADSLFEDNEKNYLTTSQMYRFEIDSLNAGTSITLASTKNVESQIIEYMKFRAPVEIVGKLAEEGGFLQKLQSLLGFKDRLVAAKEAAEISEKFEKEGVPDKAKELLREINAFANRLYDFSTKSGMSYDKLSTQKITEDRNPYNVWNVYQDFDNKIQETESKYNNAVQTANQEFYRDLRNLLEEAQEGCTEEITLSRSYPTEEMLGETDVFQEIAISKINNEGDLDTLIADVNGKWGVGFSGQYDGICQSRESKIENAGEARKNDFEQVLNNFSNTFCDWEEAAGKLYQDAINLEERILALEQEYQIQVEELKAGLNKKPEDEHYKTVYLPKIELAEANAGEIVKNLDLLKGCEDYLKEWSEGFYRNRYKASEWMNYEANQIVDEHENPSSVNAYATLCRRLKDADSAIENFYNNNRNSYSENSPYHLDNNVFRPNVYDEAAVALTKTVTEYLCVLRSHTSYFQTHYYRKDIDVKDNVEDEVKKKTTESQETEKGKAKEEAEKTDKENVDTETIKGHPDWLTTVESQEEEEDFSEFNFGGSVVNVMQTGLNLFGVIENFLEGLRDNLYVDAYVMTRFPNYVEHYVKKDSSEAKKFLGTYGNYCASYAEAEYIISGKAGTSESGFGCQSVNSVQAKLFCIRMLFNTLAIFTDSAKVQQASVLAAPCGMFAPLVMVALLAVWAAAESGLDVIELLKGESVPIFKQGGDWVFSVGGAFKKGVETVVGAVVNKGTGKAGEYLNTVINGMEGNLNRMIYEAYTSTDHGTSLQEIVQKGLGIMNTGTEFVQGSVLEYGSTLCENMAEIEKVAGTEDARKISDSLKEYQKEIDDISKKLGEYTNGITSGVTAVEENILNMRAVSRLANDVKEKTAKTLGTLSEKLTSTATDAISKQLSKVIPVGEVQNTGKTDSGNILFSYTDYLWFFLVIMNQETKVQRIQEMVQVNMRYYYATKKGVENPVEYFALQNIPVTVWADMDYSIGLFFLSNGIVPEQFRVKDKDGNVLHRLKNKVISAQSY